jgi:hypothetical protein
MVIRKFARAAKILNDSSTEYAETFHFKLSSPRPPRLGGELSETFVIFVVNQPMRTITIEVLNGI